MFHGLDTTPPKRVIPNELSLSEANCVPMGGLYFGSDEIQSNYLREDILSRVSSARALQKQALKERLFSFGVLFHSAINKLISYVLIQIFRDAKKNIEPTEAPISQQKSKSKKGKSAKGKPKWFKS